MFENNLRSLLDVLALGDHADRIDLDFQSVRYYVPGGIVAVVAKIKRWQMNGKEWRFTNYEENENFGYFQRMDVCNILGLNLRENFSRHSGSEDFVPVVRVPPSDQDVGPIASKLSACVDPNRGDTFSLLQFVTSEAVLNARQHSGGEGFVSAQFAKSKETARIGVADCGIGILESFRSNESPFYKQGMTEEQALLLALKPEVSSTTHLKTPYGHSPNRGVGLSMMRELMALSLGAMTLVSGNSWWFQSAQRAPMFGTFKHGRRFDGTVLAVAFLRSQIEDYFEMLKQARLKLGLQVPDDVGKIFL